MFNVVRMEVKDGINSDRKIVAGLGTQDEAEAMAKLLSEKFEHHGFRGEDKYHWGRNDDGEHAIFFVEGAPPLEKAK